MNSERLCSFQHYSIMTETKVAMNTNDPKSKQLAAGIGSGIGIGVAIGVAIGLLMDNLALGIGIGIAIGVGIGSAIGSRKTEQPPSE